MALARTGSRPWGGTGLTRFVAAASQRVAFATSFMTPADYRS